ncbi:MAG: hypothetical protein KDK36_12505, partial [Leptospiraceae bacterium]|nr:hypothetical protein [Leptospiraceae bacterium]
MNTFPMIPFPTMPDNPSGWEYFWFMLPFAFPGFLTFIVGVFLAFLGLIRALKKERVGYFLSFSGTCLGFGTLGLVLALRSVVKEEDSIILWNTILYPFVLLLAPCSSLLLYYFLDKKYKVLLWSSIISWVSFTFGIIGILKMEAFTGEILYYSFGKYPVASYYLKLWGIVSAFLYFFFGIPAQVHFRKSNRFKEKRYLVIGLNILLFSLISNLPSFIGISFFPGSLLAFFPMLLLAYGVFITDFEDLQKVLFQKNGLFFLINAL